ncbi:acetyltransferase (GNAT) domain-containing protein [Nocardia nova SH22a]|uniref:Acetyltransferase (GNAT) domain-containing protein n=1 Tax=Nocardia nova SH22a TaxID=1415166 RepID=W5T945_9NOCA|nr:GNAT family N-acetyltransferase [Nocardia nova]AHH15498.1 acetyltransferase (GNAT) domain-containing protein [Nocardia nova SH22a]
MDDCVLTDDTVWLSRPVEADADTIADRCREPSIAEWTVIPVPYRRADALGFLSDVVAPGWAARSPVWAVRTAADGPVVGMLGLDAKSGDGSAEIGFWLGTAARGRGLMTRSVRLACDFGFAADGLALTRIQWRAIAGNIASAAVARRAGFHYEGRLRLEGVQRGVRCDSWIAARLRTDPPGPALDWPPLTSG